MSFVPAPQQANAAVNAVVSAAPAAAAAPPNETSDFDLMFKIRTFDVYWVEKNALMYKDGIAKVK
jgi:ATP-dependent RNA helicase DDX60